MASVEDFFAELDEAGTLPDGGDLLAVIHFDETLGEPEDAAPKPRPIVARIRDAGHDAGMDASTLDAAPPEAPAAPVAHESAPDVPAVAQLANAIPSGHSDAASVAMAVVAVAGGGAAMKLYSQIAKQKHQEKMNEHAPCAARIAELEAKLAKVESASVSLGSADVDELVERIEALEKAAKARRKVVKRRA